MTRIASFARLGIIAAAAVGFMTAPSRAETITVTHWGSGFYGAPYAVALEKGYFKEAGLDITGFLTSSGGGTSVRNTLAGDIPYGEVSLAAALEAIRAGHPVKIVNTGVQTSDTIWVAKADSPLNSVKDIVGKKVGFTSPNSGSHMYILRILKESGIDQKDVTLMPVGGVGASVTAVLTGAVDASLMIEPIWSKNKHQLKKLFAARDILSPQLAETVGIVTTDFAREKPQDVKALIAARRKGVQFIKAHPDEAADIVSKAYNLEPAVTRDIFRNLLSIDYWSEGALDPKGMDNVLEGWRVIGKHQGEMDWSSVTDASFLPADLQPKS